VDRAIRRLILGLEELLDLVVGPVDRSHPLGFVGTLAAEREGRFGEGRGWRIGRRGLRLSRRRGGRHQMSSVKRSVLGQF